MEIQPVAWWKRGDRVHCFGFRASGQTVYVNLVVDSTTTLRQFWLQHQIQPYQHFVLENPTLALKKTKQSTCHTQISSRQPQLKLCRQPTWHYSKKNFFWDIETYAAWQFPDATQPTDRVFMISVVVAQATRRDVYLLTTEDVPMVKGSITRIYPTETELLSAFWALIASEQPDRLMTFYGDGFDIPYLLTRTKSPLSISKMVGLTNPTTTRELEGGFQSQTVLSLPLPGMEQIDLLTYFRKTLPSLPNHRLETVSQFLLGRGKVDLPVDQMMTAVRTKDATSLAQVAEYSRLDSILLADLWDVANVESTIEAWGNALGWTTERAVNATWKQMVEILCGDAVTFSPTAGHLVDVQPGRYENVHVYDYTEIYYAAMAESSIGRVKKLPARLRETPWPAGLLGQICQSSYVAKKEMAELLVGLLPSDLLEVTPTHLLSQGALTDPRFRLLRIIPRYLVVTASSRIEQTAAGWSRSGYASLCKATFRLNQLAVEGYLEGRDWPEVNKETPVDQLIIREKISCEASYKEDSLKAQLLDQYQTWSGQPLTTWTRVEYVQTQTGPQLYAVWKEDPTKLDYAYYQAELEASRKVVKKLTKT